MAPVNAQASLEGRDIVCVGFADWDADLWTNQHHLMSRLAAAGNTVLFVESLGLRRPELARRDISRIWRRLRRGLSPPRAVDGLHVLSPLLIPAHGHRLVRAINRRLLGALVSRAARRLGMRRPILWAYVPQAESLIDVLDPSLLVYHCVDDIAAHERIDTGAVAAEERYAARADIVLASSPPLAERLRRLARNVIYAPNVADTELFAGALHPGPVDPAMEALPHPRILFTGAIVQIKLDFELIGELARLRPDWSIALVGPVGPGDPSTDVSALAAQPNIHLLGHRPHVALPSVLRGADAAIIPYAINQLTRSIFPMKVYEYLAAGLPVVATPLPSLAEVGEIATGTSASEMAALLDRALAEDGPQRRAERSRIASRHSWDARLREIAEAIASIEAADGTGVPG